MATEQGEDFKALFKLFAARIFTNVYRLHPGRGLELFKRGMFLANLCFIQHCPSVSPVSEDAGIEPRTVATLALALTQTLEPLVLDLIYKIGKISPTTLLDLIHNSARTHP